MSFKRHDCFKSAPSLDSKLWRYMNLPKFLSLLQQNSLFMYNLEKMAVDDPFEGILPSGNFIHRNWETIADVPCPVVEDLKKKVLYYETGDLNACLKVEKENRELRIKQAYAHRRSYFINCWHMNDFESLAMWDIYSRRDEGIAIVSSERNFINAFKNVNKDIFGGVVSYEDYNNFAVDLTSGFNAVLHKRNSFKYEQEYRLVFWDTDVTHKYVPLPLVEIIPDGQGFRQQVTFGRASTGRSEDEIESTEPINHFNLPCDLNDLINEVYISPSAPKWFFDVIQDIVLRYNLKVPVIQSSISQSPLR